MAQFEMCAEGEHINDDNPGRPICRTCDDDPNVAALYPREVDQLFVKLYEAVAACEAPEGTQVDDVLAEFQKAYHEATVPPSGPPVLGDYVKVAPYGHRGRVYQVHHWCPQDEEWLAVQQDQSVRQHVDEHWVSVLVHDGGSVVAPAAKAEIVEPFDFVNPYASMYFR